MTKEEEVSYFLRDWYAANKAVVIHSWHPPSGKTYEGALVRIPRIVDGIRTRERYHIDFIIQVGDILILQELKGSATETTADVAKLREIIQTYSLEQLIRVLRPRVTGQNALNNVTTLLPSIAHAPPVPHDIEPDFLWVIADGQSCAVEIGTAVNASSCATITSAFT